MKPDRSEFTEDPPAPLELPEPEVRDAEIEEADLPQGVRTLLKQAREHGWEVLVRYSRGPWQVSNRDAFTIKRMIAIGAARVVDGEAQSFRASWLSMDTDPPKWVFNAAHLANVPGIQTSKALKAYIKGEEVTA